MYSLVYRVGERNIMDRDSHPAHISEVDAGKLVWRCPVGHEVKVFLPGETEKVRLRVWCTQCDRDYKYRVPGRAPADLDLFGGND